MTKTISSRERLRSSLKKSDDIISDEANNNTNTGVARSTEQLIGGLQIIHATTGRVRIRATDSSHNSILDTVAQNLKQQKGVREVFINDQTGSLAVYFDEKQLSLPQMLEFLQEFGVNPMQTSPQSESKTDPFAAWKSLDFWKEQGISLIPLIAGLTVTGRLGITGWVSFPVYWITANATRQVIHHLEPQLSASAVKQPQTSQSLSTSKSKVGQTSTKVAVGSAKIAYHIVHAIPGRIRFNVPRIARDRAYARRLERLLKTDSYVSSVRLNCDAGSIAINYSSSETPVSHWERLMQLADETVVSQTPLQNNQPNPIASTTTIEPSNLVADSLWSEYKSPALSAALSFMANFPLDLVPY